MKIYNHLKELKNTSLALGFFDGIHIGHTAVINSALNNDGISAVITFKKHPLELISDKKIKYIITNEKKSEILEKMGIEYLFELDFTNELLKMSAQEYIKDILVKYFNPLTISTGYNHTFGYKQSGSTNLLEKLQSQYDYKYIRVEEQKIDGLTVSSTAVKKTISDGDIELTNKMLGHEFSISGTVIKGQQLGRTIGFPTANIEYPNNIQEIPYGVYSTLINNYKAITYYGVRPTLDNKTPLLETHIINFDKNIYDKKIEIKFIKKIRNEKKFNSVNELQEQIKKDIDLC